MVELKDPNPEEPTAGKKFSLTAHHGIEPYKFSVDINNVLFTAFQDDPSVVIEIPKDARGKFEIQVKDGRHDVDSMTLEIRSLESSE